MAMSKQMKVTLLAMVSEYCRQEGLSTEEVSELFSVENVRLWYQVRAQDGALPIKCEWPFGENLG